MEVDLLVGLGGAFEGDCETTGYVSSVFSVDVASDETLDCEQGGLVYLEGLGGLVGHLGTFVEGDLLGRDVFP